MYREILRHCQLLRKEAGFAVSDRIVLSFATETRAIESVIQAYEKDLARESLAEIRDITVPVMSKEVHLDDGKILIAAALI